MRTLNLCLTLLYGGQSGEREDGGGHLDKRKTIIIIIRVIDVTTRHSLFIIYHF